MAFPDRRRELIGIVLALAGASMLYRILHLGRLEQTSALFIGLPAFLAVVLVSVARPRSTMGVVLTATTLALLLSGIVLGEGFICILMASPLFFTVAILIVLLDEWVKRRRDKLRVAVFLPFAALALEGVLPGFEFERESRVTVEVTLPVPPERFEAALARAPAFKPPLPLALRPGFPRPVAASGDGLAPGDRRRVAFAARGRTFPVEFAVSERAEGRVSMALLSDETPIAHWLTWRGSRFEWREVDGGTRVRLTLDYRRELDPAWYFGPLERLVVREAGKYLLKSIEAAGER